MRLPGMRNVIEPLQKFYHSADAKATGIALSPKLCMLLSTSRLHILAGGTGRFAITALICFVEGVCSGVSHGFGYFLDGQGGIPKHLMRFFHTKVFYVGGKCFPDAGMYALLKGGRGNMEAIRDHGNTQLLVANIFIDKSKNTLIQILHLTGVLLI